MTWPFDSISRWISPPPMVPLASAVTDAVNEAQQRAAEALAAAQAEAARVADEAEASQCVQDTFSSVSPKKELVYISDSDNAPREIAALQRAGAKLTAPKKTTIDDVKKKACLTDAEEGTLTDDAKAFAPTFAEAEHGARDMSRLAISGHGGVNGPFVLGIADAASLAKVYPKAAAQVEHLMGASCHSNHAASFEEWKKIYPNLKTLAGYDRSAPSGALAAAQLQQWELTSRRGGTSLAGLDPEVSTWTVSRGFRGTQPAESYDNLEAADILASNHGVYHRYETGVTPLAKATNDPELNTYYLLLQRLARHQDASPEMRAYYSQKANKVLRWRHPELASETE